VARHRSGRGQAAWVTLRGCLEGHTSEKFYCSMPVTLNGGDDEDD
jgi:hypothetical protein